MTRLEGNREVIRLLSSLIEAFPDHRFNQILWNLGFTEDPQKEFYWEPWDLLERVKKNIESGGYTLNGDF